MIRPGGVETGAVRRGARCEARIAVRTTSRKGALGLVRETPDPFRFDAYAAAMRRGAYFAAHEILETSWRTNRNEREQTLIWIAAAFVHWARGRRQGVEKLLAKVAGRVRAIDPSGPLDDLVAVWRRAVEEGQPCPGIGPAEIDVMVAWAREPGREQRMAPPPPDTS